MVKIFGSFVFLVSSYSCFSQETVSRLNIISQPKAYEKSVAADPGKIMIELKTAIPLLVYDLKYASADNFMKRRMYAAHTTKTFLRKPAADSLGKVAATLARQGLGLKIYDAYRPYSVTKRFWKLVHDERYVANPAKGSKHNRGTAVDLTIIDLQTGKELDMGTGFDNFTDTAHHAFTALLATILRNRSLLKSTMEEYGFQALDSEWWHYGFESKTEFEVLDIPFKKLNTR